MNCLIPFKKNYNALTLLELVLVVFILSFLVSFGIPRYQRVIQQARERDAIVNLQMIKAAQVIYRSEMDQYYPGNNTGVVDLDAINQNLNLGLMLPNYLQHYSCAGGPDDFDCRAQAAAPANWIYRITETLDAPECVSGNCSF